MRKRILSMITMVGMLLSMMTMPTYAKELENIQTVETEGIRIEETNTENVLRSAYIAQDSGILQNNVKNYTITVTQSGTYSFTLSSRYVSGSDGIWTILEKQGGSPRYLDRNISGTFQQRYSLSAGTYHLMLSSASGSNIFSFTLEKL